MGNSTVSKCNYKIAKLVIGLGNPGWFYKNTRHNVGKKFIEHIFEQKNLKIDHIKGGEIAYLPQKSGNEYVAFFKTNGFMNLSGSPTKHAFEFCELSNIKDIIVVVDDLEQGFGKYRIKNGGSAQGHNGVKSIIENFNGDKDFKKLLIGIDRPASKASFEVARYVTGNFDQESLRRLEDELFPDIFEFLNLNENLNL